MAITIFTKAFRRVRVRSKISLRGLEKKSRALKTPLKKGESFNKPGFLPRRAMHFPVW